jgi:translation elongation factor EF-1beta
MILIIRMSTDGDAKKMWSAIMEQKDSMQSALGKNGKLLYLAKRVDFNEANLYIHTSDIMSIINLVTEHLSTVDEVSAISIVHLIKPRFFPVPKDTYNFKRFIISLKVHPKSLKAVYKKLLNPNLPEGIRKVYYTFTFQNSNEALQYCVLAEDEESVQKYIAESIHSIDGIIKTELHQAEKTKPFISYKEWLKYTSEGNDVPAWHHYMENHFDFVEKG